MENNKNIYKIHEKEVIRKTINKKIKSHGIPMRKVASDCTLRSDPPTLALIKSGKKMKKRKKCEK